jgi:hypothetical protein
MNKQKLALGVAALGVAAPGMYVLFLRPWIKRWEATNEERQQSLPGDDTIVTPNYVSTRAITIRARARANPKVTLLVIDPKDGSRWIEVRGKVVEIRREGAEAHADELTQRYTGKRRFYGDIYPVEQKQKETRVIVKIEPIKVSLDAIFK